MKKINEFFRKPYLYLFITILGCSIKFYHVDTLLFWEDEMSTILQTQGVVSDPPLNQIKSISYYDSLIRISTRPVSSFDQLYGQATTVNLTPGHYSFLVFWNRIVGDDPMDFRLFSVFIFFITLPVLFLLLRELLGSDLAGWIGISLYSTSPFIHYSSQEARYYILWTLFYFLLIFLFLKAIREDTKKWWLLYVLVACLSMYTSVLSAVFIAGQFMYVLFFKKSLLLKHTIYLTVVVLVYSPWMYFMYAHAGEIQEVLGWHSVIPSNYGVFTIPLMIMLGYAHTFWMMLNMPGYWTIDQAGITENWMIFSINIILILLILYFIYYLFRKTPKEIAWLLAALVFPMALFFIGSDILRQTNTSGFFRYHIISVAGIILITTNYLQAKIKEGDWKVSGIYLSLVVIGIISIYFKLQNRCWMSRPDCEACIADSELYNEAKKPLIITDWALYNSNFMVLMNECKSPAIDVIYADQRLDLESTIKGKDYSDIFATQITDELLEVLKTKYKDKISPLKKELGPFDVQIWRIDM